MCNDMLIRDRTTPLPSRQKLAMIGQFLFWLGVSFLGCFLLLRKFPTPRNDHLHDDQIVQGQQTSRTPQVTYDKAQVQQDLAQLTQALLGNEHYAADEFTHGAANKLDNLCSAYTDLCKKTSREGTYTLADQYLYQAVSIILITMVDKTLVTPGRLYDTLSLLKIYQNTTDRRGSSGHTNVKINTEKITSLREYREVLSHEFGHTIDLGVLQGNSRIKNKLFTEFGKIIRPNDDLSLVFYKISRADETTRKANASFRDFVSGYAMKGVYEDFAETNNMWLNHNALFKSLAQDSEIIARKYNFFQKLYGTSRFDADEDMLGNRSTQTRVWDSTKIGNS